jgi:hypothetical protein
LDLLLSELILSGVSQVERMFGRRAWAGAREPRRLDIRDQSKNHGSVVLAMALLSVFRNLNGVIVGLRQDEHFNLKAQFGLDPTPLDSLNTSSPELVDVVRCVLSGYRDDTARGCKLFIEHLHAIHNERLLGRQTAGKLAYVRDVAGIGLRKLGPNDLETHLIKLRRRTLGLLNLQRKRLAKCGRRNITLDRMIERIVSDIPAAAVRSHRILARFRDYPELAYSLKEMFLEYPKVYRSAIGDPAAWIEMFCTVYTDELSQIIGRFLKSADSMPLTFRRGTGIEVGFAFRDEEFITLGDRYGDCTARIVRSQVDPNVANVHWTVYPWLLDPFYRVLEVTLDGTPAVKAHILPLVINDRPILALDAIEVVPTLRDQFGNRSNIFISERLHERRIELVGALFDVVRKLGRRMGAEAVYVDKFSNCGWVREVIDELPSVSYSVRRVLKPFGVSAVQKLIEEILGKEYAPDLPVAEVQALNIALMDQGLRAGYKEVGVLDGESDDWVAVRGP